MTSDRPLHEDSNAVSPEDVPVDAIPVLEEALEPEASDLPLDLPEDEVPVIMDAVDTVAPFEEADTQEISESTVELKVDLGYALDSAEESDSLAEMEEIQTLPLAEMVLDDPATPFSPGALDEDHKRHIATLEAIVFESEDPMAPAPKYQAPEPPAPPPQVQEPVPPPITPAPPVPPLAQPKPLPTKSENPFLPQHILDRLNQGKRNLVEEIAQSSAALDASTAILRTHARAERLNRPSYADPKSQSHSFSRDKLTLQKQKIIDELVEEYMPLLAAELRRRLRRLLDE
jgi:hypothetical protein